MSDVIIHYATDYSTGDQVVPTACGIKVSTWNDEPDQGTSHERDVTCHACLLCVVRQLRDSLDKQAKSNIESLTICRAERAAHERTKERVREVIDRYYRRWDDGGDRPPSPPAALVRFVSELEAALAAPEAGGGE